MKLQFAILLAGLLSLSVAHAAPFPKKSHDGPIGHGGDDDGSTPVKRDTEPAVRFNAPIDGPHLRPDEPIVHQRSLRTVSFGEQGVKIDDPRVQRTTPHGYKREISYDGINARGDYQSSVGSKPGTGLPPRTNKPPGGGAGRSRKRGLATTDYVWPRSSYQSTLSEQPPDTNLPGGGESRSGRRDLKDEDSADYSWAREDYQSKVNNGQPAPGGSPGHWLPAPTGKAAGCGQCRTGKRDLTDGKVAGDYILSRQPLVEKPPSGGSAPGGGDQGIGGGPGPKRDLADLQEGAGAYVWLRGGQDGGDEAIGSPGGRRDLAGEEDSASDYFLRRDEFAQEPRDDVISGGENGSVGAGSPGKPGGP